MIAEPEYKVYVKNVDELEAFIEERMKIYPLPNDIYGIQVGENTVLVTSEEYAELLLLMTETAIAMELLGEEE